LGELSALLDRVNFPEAVPEAFGLNRTVTWTFCPAAMARGKLRPGSLNSELFTCAEEMVTEPFEAESVSCRLARDPTTTLPKFRLEGETPRVAAWTATPVPQTLNVNLGFRASLMRVIVPVVFPVANGLNLTVNWVLFPGRRVTGSGKLPKKKSLVIFPLGKNMERSLSRVGQLEDVLLGSADLDSAVAVVARVTFEMLGRGIGERPGRQK
jgi:hypothetical protein